MFSLNNFRTNLTQKLDEITVFWKYRDASGILEIQEQDKEDKKGYDALLKLEITALPNSNVWVFENEYNHQQFLNNDFLQSQKGAFTSGGNKVEKTIIWYDGNDKRFYICMFEMKRAITADKFSEVKKKYVGALNTFSVFIASNPNFTDIKDAQIYPIGICCFNRDHTNKDTSHEKYKNTNKSERRPDSGSQTTFTEKYIKDAKKEFYLEIAPKALSILNIPVVLCKNPSQSPITNNFQIDFNDIIKRATTISVVPKPPKTTIFQ